MTSATTFRAAPLSGPTGQLVEARRAAMRDVLRRHGASNARLFGSIARGDDHEGSDVDILVDFAPHMSLFAILRMQDELEALLGVQVDLISGAALKDRVRDRVQRDLIAL